MSRRGRQPVYWQNSNTIMNLLADFHSYQYGLSKIEGFTIHLQDKITTISIPKNMYSSVRSVPVTLLTCRLSSTNSSG